MSAPWLLPWSIGDDASASVNNEDSNYPISNILTPDAELEFRSNTTGVHHIDIDLSEISLIDTVGLMACNINFGDYVILKIYSDSARTNLLHYERKTGGFPTSGWGSQPGYGYLPYGASGFVYAGPDRNDVLFDVPDIVAQYITITVDTRNSSNADLRIGRLKMGQRIAYAGCSDTYVWGYQMGWAVPDQNHRFRRASVMFERSSAEQVDLYHRLQFSHGHGPNEMQRTRGGRLIGLRDDILWSGVPEAEDELRRTNYGLMALSSWTPPTRTNAAMIETTLDMIEVYGYGN